MWKKALLAVAAVLVVIQFIRPERNLTNDKTYDISTAYHVPANVAGIFEVACNDCHTNKTEYPWYSNIQPVAWWLANHVNDGKRHFNMSEFTRLPIAVQNHKLEEVIEMVKEHEMPLPSYTYLGLHSEANLTDEQRVEITDWASRQMDSLKRVWPADSLVMKRRR